MHGFFGQELMILRMDWFNLVQLQPQSKHLTGWWYTYPFEKYESIGMMKFPTEWENQNHVGLKLLNAFLDNLSQIILAFSADVLEVSSRVPSSGLRDEPKNVCVGS